MMNLPLFGVVNSAEMERVVVDVLRSGKIASGEYVTKFEAGLGELLGKKNVVTTVDMTSAMHLALYIAGVGVGDEVITSPFSCLATNSPIATLGATPVWVDLLPDSVLIDVKAFKASITPKTKAAIVYHVAGYPAPIEEIAAICREYKIILVEDCDNALLATVNGKQVGSWGDFSVYSFYPNRQINASEGGALVCRLEQDAIKAKRLRRFGINSSQFRRTDGEINPLEDVKEAGWACTLNNLCSALGYMQLPDVHRRVDAARRNAKYLDQYFFGSKKIVPIKPIDGSTPSYWVYLIVSSNRDALLAGLKELGIFASILHQNNHIYSCFAKNAHEQGLKNANELQKNIIALPCGWWLDSDDMQKIATAVLALA
ncbi:DegT/DnrJ/EryC1/StrS family aminotransferase [Iodobacter fluviatilis]|uniref:Pyridoxal-phosphate-dependent/plp-dependent aminotransferase n=1 Tax=Iodobacter fluviatilis TaxID=537 RepID=A0A7G3G8I9_9NEIS|nr:DegT/DnrJ/EryC1/StrS family aminotransferase [Iodobacter fluviatilis]QBC43125.1 pyridoxal-phosphate-dependent/plp-dependent aminotransferase [Iodobacter fluviatilis]